MKARNIALASVLGALAIGVTVASVIGLSQLLKPGSGHDRSVAQRGGDPVAPFVPADPGPAPMWDLRDVDPVDDLDVFVPPVEEKGRPVERVRDVRGPAVAATETRISGPFKHENLSVFLVHGPDKLADARILTLQEALDTNVATVHEGLSITNRSDKTLFVQAGDIVKGGNQDRVLPYDYLIPAGARNFPVAALCVESGRSFPRGGELSSSFAVSCERLPTRDLRLAAYRRDQGSVWGGVKRTQEALDRALGVSVRSPLSPTSLQLTLEHPAVARGTLKHVDALAGQAEKAKDAIGMVVVVNGKIISADVYASAALFQKLYSKLLRAAAVEALTAPRAASADGPTAEAVVSFLAVSDSVPASERGTAGRLNLVTQETGAALLFDACDREAGNLVLHRTLLAR